MISPIPDYHSLAAPWRIFQQEKTVSLKVLERFWRRARSSSSSAEFVSSCATKFVVAIGIGGGIGLGVRESSLVLECCFFCLICNPES